MGNAPTTGSSSSASATPPSSSRPDEFASVMPTPSQSTKEECPSQAEAVPSAAPTKCVTNNAPTTASSAPAPPPLKLGIKQAFQLNLGKSSTSSSATPPPQVSSLPIGKLNNLPSPGDNAEQGAWSRSEDVIKREKLAKYQEVCSCVLPYLFVGGQDVALSKATLTAMGITHVVNCAGLTVDNAFPSDLRYIKLNMVDGKEEDILWFVHRVIGFIEDARVSGGEEAKVLVHCSQGVSRSCALVIAYIMWLRRCDFQQAFDEVKRCRPIASPNSAFICNLLEWGKYRAEQEASPVGLVFRMAIHSPYDKDTLVPKLCRNPQDRTLLPASSSALDSRGTFVIQPAPQANGQRCLYVWRGQQATDESVVVAQDFAQHFNRVESLGCEIVPVKEGDGGQVSLLKSLLLPPSDPAAALYDDLLPKADMATSNIVNPAPVGGMETGFKINAIKSIPPIASPSPLPPPPLPLPTVALRPTSTCSPPPQQQPEPPPPSSPSPPGPKLYKLLQLSDEPKGVLDWEDMGVYDADDLEPEGLYLLHHPTEGSFLWVGSDFPVPRARVVSAAVEGEEEEGKEDSSTDDVLGAVTEWTCTEAWVESDVLSRFGIVHSKEQPLLRLELEGEETEEFWSLLESGY